MRLTEKDKDGKWIYIEKEITLVYDDDGYLAKSEVCYHMHRGQHVDKLAAYENYDEAIDNRNKSLMERDKHRGFSPRFEF